ncbi:MAG: hypothetical protein A2133_04720 [Actinobacteria bacterium RBG_16_64_13]|nr:MAG: hypothetical protein A2133_04720 [Actinobacteria bacterium RBG_16_64_13]
MPRRRFSGRWFASMAAFFAIVVAVSAFASGCGGDNKPGDSVKHPSGKTELVFQVSTGGGFVPIEYNLTHVPEFSLYGDGTVIVVGPMIEIYPGPAMPNLQATEISEEAVQAILSAAREVGLFNPTFDYGQPSVADAPTTTITINANGTTYQSGIYALGFESTPGNMTLEQQQARAAVGGLLGKLTDLATFESGEIKWEPSEFSSLAVYSLGIDPGYTPDVEPNKLDWPLGDLSTLGNAAQPQGYRKAVITGKDLDTLKPLLAQATQITIWASGDREYNLMFRPLLPNETE